MENKGYLIYEVGIFGGNDKGEIKFILFLLFESMADANKAVMEYLGKENMLYINVANRLSVDCDCDSNPKEPEMADIGIFASLDPVAIDQASVDAVYNSPDPGKKALIERMESRNGIHTIEAASKLGLGNREYESG